MDPTNVYLDYTSVYTGNLTYYYMWYDLRFGTTPELDVDKGYAIVLMAASSSYTGEIQWEYHRLATQHYDDGTERRYSVNGGSSWSPTDIHDQQDNRIMIYGKYQLPTPAADPIIASGTLNTIYIDIETIEDGRVVSLSGAVECINRPDLTGFARNDLPLADTTSH